VPIAEQKSGDIPEGGIFGIFRGISKCLFI
jgi:hypothetical protein